MINKQRLLVWNKIYIITIVDKIITCNSFLTKIVWKAFQWFDLHSKYFFNKIF